MVLKVVAWAILGSSSVFLALSLVLIYRGTHVINLFFSCNLLLQGGLSQEPRRVKGKWFSSSSTQPRAISNRVASLCCNEILCTKTSGRLDLAYGLKFPNPALDYSIALWLMGPPEGFPPRATCFHTTIRRIFLKYKPDGDGIFQRDTDIKCLCSFTLSQNSGF